MTPRSKSKGLQRKKKKLVPESLNEVRNFERTSDVGKSLKMGKYNPELWRKKHDGKPIMEVVVGISTPSGSQLTYHLPVKYGMNWEGYKDTIWFGSEKLMENGVQIPMKSLDSPNPLYWGDEDEVERTMWSNQEIFEKEWIENIINDNAEKPFEDLQMEMTEGLKFRDEFEKWLEEGGNTMTYIKYISL
jgi:hypothetical protein